MGERRRETEGDKGASQAERKLFSKIIRLFENNRQAIEKIVPDETEKQNSNN